MKRTIFLLFILTLLSGLSGFLMSKASWIGRVGMTLFYKEYNLLKIWWQGGIAVLIFILLLFTVHTIIHKKLPITAARTLHALLLLAAVAGLYFTYDDFTGNFSHRVLGRRFHYGFYLVWVQWMLVCLFFLFKRRVTKTIVTNSDKTELTTG